MTKAEEMAQNLVASGSLQPYQIMMAMYDYGNFVKEAAAKAAQSCMDANHREGMLVKRHGITTQYDAANTIREMPLP